MTSLITVKDLSFSYISGVKALDGINLDIGKGEVIAIVGHNGSGKTTLVKHFNGLLKPTSGVVLVNGIPTVGLTTAHLSRTVGYVFQNPDDQIFNSSIYSEVSFGPSNIGLKGSKLKSRVNEALELTGLSSIKGKHPLDLNLNEKKMTTIASVIAMKPEVIILDEPTSGQDHDGVKRVELLVKELSKSHTVILISHDMGLVSRVANRIIMMWDSRLIFDGPIREAFTKNDLLAKTDLNPPVITELAQRVGLMPDIFTVGEFIDALKKRK